MLISGKEWLANTRIWGRNVIVSKELLCWKPSSLRGKICGGKDCRMWRSENTGDESTRALLRDRREKDLCLWFDEKKVYFSISKKKLNVKSQKPLQNFILVFPARKIWFSFFQNDSGGRSFLWSRKGVILLLPLSQRCLAPQWSRFHLIPHSIPSTDSKCLMDTALWLKCWIRTQTGFSSGLPWHFLLKNWAMPLMSVLPIHEGLPAWGIRDLL